MVCIVILERRAPNRLLLEQFGLVVIREVNKADLNRSFLALVLFEA